MSALSAFFAENEQLILFLYGLVFFVMGLAIVLQSRRASRLELARSLGWLAAFGILHGLNEWGDLFIPIQAAYSSETLIRLLYILQLVLLSLSFAFLFQFGASLLNTLGKARWLRSAPLILFGLWIFITFFVMTTFAIDTLTWYRIANALARYFIAFPAGLAAAYGLREHAIQRIAPLQVPAIYNMLRVAGISLVLYSIFGGLITPPIPFPPGNILNAPAFAHWVGIPAMAFRSLIGLVMAVTIIRALEVFEVETDRRIEALEQRSIINAERERIARELHDGAIQKVYTAGLLVESASKLAGKETEMFTRLDRAQTALNDSIADLRRNLTELNSDSTQQAEPLAAELERIAAEPRYTAMVIIDLKLKIPRQATLPALRTGHLVSILNEALANIVRHAHAHKVRILAEDGGETLKVTVEDDGRGFSEGAPSGYGLRNMHDRARLLNGNLTVQSVPHKGTTLTVEIPWSD
jgi:signal transduction histidine kinase